MFLLKWCWYCLILWISRCVKCVGLGLSHWLYVSERGMICWKGFLCEGKSGWLFKTRVVEVRWSSILAVLFFVNIQAYIQISVARDSIKMQIYRVTKGGHLHLSKTFVKPDPTSRTALFSLIPNISQAHASPPNYSWGISIRPILTPQHT